MPHLKPFFVVFVLALVASLFPCDLEASSLAGGDLRSVGQEEIRWPHPLEIGPVVEPNGLRGDLKIGPVVEPNGWSVGDRFEISERVLSCEPLGAPNPKETCSSTIVEPNGLGWSAL